MTKVIAMRIGQPAILEDVEIESIQEFVGGIFEGHAFGEPDLMIYCNSYGKERCPPNRWCGRLEDVIHGHFMVVRALNGVEVDVTEEDFAKCRSLFNLTTAGWG